MKIPKLLLPLGATMALGLGWTISGAAETTAGPVEATPAEDGQIVPAARPTPPATRPLDPTTARERTRDPAAVRHPRDVPMVDTDPEHFIQNARDLLSQEVVTEQGQHLGSVEDLIIDVNTGHVAFVAVGPEPRLRPVPPTAFRPRPEENLLILDVEADRWERAPTIERHEIAQLARDRDARRIYRHYGQAYQPPAVAALEPTEPQVFGSPARWQHRHATEGNRLPGDPAVSRAEPRVLPPDRTGVHPDLRWEREFGTPRERELMQEQWEERRAEARRRAAERREDVREFGAPPRAEAERPSLRNPRLHHSHRGTQRVPHAWGTEVEEWGAPPAERDLWTPRARLPREERMQWASNLIEQRAADWRTDEMIGQVEDIVVDLNRGQVQHVIVSHEAMGEMFAIPFADMEVDEAHRVRVRAERGILEQAPRYDPREARLQPQRAYRYQEREMREFGVPERDREPGDPRL